MADKYETIAKKMGSAWSPEIEKILKALFSPEEADILLVFNGPFMDRFTAKKIARKVKRPVEEVEPILLEMTRTQRVFSAVKDETRTYSLFPLLPGLFELYFSNHERAAAEENDILMLFTEEYEKYYNKGYIVNTFNSTYPFMRVFVDQKVVDDTVDRGKGKVVDVDQEVDQVKNDILPFEQAKAIIEKSHKISVMDCACRTHMKIHNDGTPVNEYPINVCMAFNTTAEDARIRNELYKSLGAKRTREVLAKLYPSGSAAKDLEQRLAKIQEEEQLETISKDQTNNVIDEVIAEIFEKSKSM